MNSGNSRSHRRLLRAPAGLTLIEMLVVLVIIGMMIGLLLPAIQMTRESARRMQCTQNIQQVIIAVHNYQLTHRMLPYGTLDPSVRIDNRPKGYHHGWITQILPYLEEKAAFRAIDRTVGVYDRRNTPARTMYFQVLICTSSFTNGAAHSNYAGVHHSIETPIAATNNGVFVLNQAIRRKDITDGAAQTLFIGEKQIDGGTDLGWMSGSRATLRNLGGGINSVLMPGGGGALPVNEDLASAPIVGYNKWELPGLPADAEQIVKRHAAGVKNFDKESADAPLGADEGSFGGFDGMGMGGPLNQPPQNSKRGSKPQLFVGGFGSNHTNGANFAFGDGHVALLSEDIDLVALQQMADRADGKLLRARR